MIEERTVFHTMGRDFDSEEKALQFRHDQVGAFLDKAGAWGGTVGPRDMIRVVEVLTKHRRELCNLLDY